MIHTIIDILRNTILITGLVVVMMMLIESLNIESKGGFFSGLKSSKIGQVVFSALLGSIPGCMGGFASVSLYTHRLISFGALIAMMIASSGDEAFMMIAMIPDKAVWIIPLLFGIAVLAGVLTDIVGAGMRTSEKRKAVGADRMSCNQDFEIHDGHTGGESHPSERHLSWKRGVMFAGVAVFIAALASGTLDHEHVNEPAGTEVVIHNHDARTEHHEHICDVHPQEQGFAIDLLSETWMNWLFAVLSLIVLAFLVFGSDHFIEEHLWKHIVCKHLPGIFLWTLGVLVFITVGLQYLDLSRWITDNTALMIVLATLVGIIPESGPHLVFLTLYASGLVPFPVLLASCISQDGHASIPLLAESKKSFVKAKLLNCAVALVAGFAAMLF